jgi:hypothetical protein
MKKSIRLFETAVVIPTSMSPFVVVPHETETDDCVLNSRNVWNVDQFETVAVEQNWTR